MVTLVAVPQQTTLFVAGSVLDELFLFQWAQFVLCKCPNGVSRLVAAPLWRTTVCYWDYARGKNQRVGERGEEKTPRAGLLKQSRKSNRDLMQAEDQGQDRK